MLCFRFAALLTSALALAGCDADAPPAAQTSTDAPSRSGQVLAQPGKTETRKFRDWLAVCDNGNDCFAYGPGVGGETGWVRISLEAGPTARPMVAAGFWGETLDSVGDHGLALDIDGRMYEAPPAFDGLGEAIYAGVVQQDTVAIIDALASGRRLALVHTEQRVNVSLNGASAALLWIDERQGRLGTTTALVRRGEQPASAVRPAPPLPSITAAPPVAQTGLPEVPVLPAALEARADVRQCRADTGFSENFQRSISVYRVTGNQELWSVPCFSGAYNFGHRYFVTGPGGADPRPLSFPTSRDPADEVVNAEFDPVSQTLSAFNKGRGLGDCGIAATWLWTGRDFALQSESEMRECWGVPADAWPTTWRTR